MSGSVPGMGETPAFGPGRLRQNAIYRAGALGRRPRVPTDPTGLEQAARRAMSADAWAYVAGGAGDGNMLRFITLLLCYNAFYFALTLTVLSWGVA